MMRILLKMWNSMDLCRNTKCMWEVNFINKMCFEKRLLRSFFMIYYTPL